MTIPTEEAGPPLHGFRGDAVTPPPAVRPCGLTVAVSREAGARGGNIARRAARELGWQVYDQDALDFLLRDDTARADLSADLPTGVQTWADAQFARLLADRHLTAGSGAAAVVRVLLALAARGEAVIVGRGAGFVLPAATTVHVRVVAPRAERVAYTADWLRLSPDEAAAELASREARRAKFLAAVTPRDPADVYAYDLVLNSGRLGEEAAAGLIVQAVRGRHFGDDSSAEFEVAG